MAGQERLPGSGGGGGGKLRLKRKRPPCEAPAGSGLPPRGRLQIESGGSCWLEEPNLCEADSTWLALLKDADPQLNRSSAEKMTRLPEFLKESSQITNPQPKPETFNIGLEQFPWEPFPLYHREVKMIDHRINRNLESPTIQAAEQEINDDEKTYIISPVPYQKLLITNEHTTEESRPRQSAGHSSKDCRKKVKNSQHTRDEDSPTYSAPVPKHCSSEKLSLQKLWEKTTTQNKKKSRRKNEKEGASSDTLTQNNLFNTTTSLFPSQRSPVDSSARGLLQKPGNPQEDISTLDCCPMCQVQFTSALSQLDRDSHLARCLSESTEDVVW